MFTPNGLRDAFEAQGELGFTYWSYATNDWLQEVLRPDYFRSMCGRMRLGDLVLVGTRPRPSGSALRNHTGETRRALLMVSAVAPGIVRTRLVQDYGCADDPPLRPDVSDRAGSGPERAPAPRKRGRPRKALAEMGPGGSTRPDARMAA